jgi:hypothetical protein
MDPIRLRDWAYEHRMDAVIWTDLPPNFTERVGRPFSVAVAEQYLRQLTPEQMAGARNYILNAPAEVSTPLRRHLAAVGWL